MPLIGKKTNNDSFTVFLFFPFYVVDSHRLVISHPEKKKHCVSLSDVFRVIILKIFVVEHED